MDDRLVRSKSVTFTGVPGTSWSVNFDEPTPMDNTHLILLVVATGSASGPVAITTPAGWTRASATVPIFAIRGDSVVNGITITTASVSEVTLTLMAYSGYVSATALTSGRVIVAASSTDMTVQGLSYLGSYGVQIQAIEANTSLSSSVWQRQYGTTWTDTIGVFAASNGEPDAANLRTFRQEWLQGYGQASSNTRLHRDVAVAGYRRFSAAYQLVEVNHDSGIPPEVGPIASWGFNEGSGSFSAGRAAMIDARALNDPWTPDGHYESGGMSNPAFVAPPSNWCMLDICRGATAVDKIISQQATICPTFTIMMWLRADSYPDAVQEVRNFAYMNNNLGLGVRANGTLSGMAGVTSSYVMPTGTWVHIALTHTANTARLYINGVLDTTATVSNYLLGSYMVMGGFWAGGGVYGLGQNFLGKFDDVRIFDSVLDATAITAWMNTPVTNSSIYDLEGEVPVVSLAEGAIVSRFAFDGEVVVLSSTEGAIASRLALGGEVPVLSATEGVIGALRAMDGEVPILSGASGDVAARLAAAGTVSVLSQASGSIHTRQVMGGTVTVLSAASGEMVSILTFDGLVPITSATEGDLSATHTLLGTVSVISDSEGDIALHVGLDGTVVILSTTSGEIVTPTPPLHGPLTLFGYAERYGLCGEVLNLSLIGEVPHLTLEGSAE